MTELKIERLVRDTTLGGLEVICLTITDGANRLTCDIPSFLSHEIVRIATDPDAKPFILTNH